MTQKIDALIEAYAATRLDYDQKHAESVLADRAHKMAKARLVEAMLELGQTGVKLENGLAFNLRNQFSISCSETNEEQVLGWLQDHYGDAEQFVIPRANKRAIVDRLKADIEDSLLDEIDVPEFLNLKTRPDVSCTGWKAYSETQRVQK